MATITNSPEFSVSELAASLKRTLENSYEHVRVRGELSRITIASSGHLYADLKDQGAVINIICWRTQMTRLGIKPEEGLEVICTGKITTYPARSNYQMIIERMELAGQGALLKMLDDRRKKLAAEGLFDLDRKRLLPYLPEVIGVVTSPTGAVIRDILHRLDERFPRRVLIWPVRVQGDGAHKEIAKAINGFNDLAKTGNIPRPDLIIVARGGGSLEDLMAFNEESVVRAAAASLIPLISAVGHETDTTLIDFASDLRAPTPSAAAEKAVPVKADLETTTAESSLRLSNALKRLLKDKLKEIDALYGRFLKPLHLVNLKTQRLDQATLRLDYTFTNLLDKLRSKIIVHSARLQHPQKQVRDLEKQFIRLLNYFDQIHNRLFVKQHDDLNVTIRMLESLSFERVLERGFTVIRGQSGCIITSAAQARLENSLNVQFKDQEHIRVFPDKA